MYLYTNVDIETNANINKRCPATPIHMAKRALVV